MVSVVHKTPGLIPIEAFTIAGLSAKPNSNNPIGRFGTGLKYAIAVLVRMNIKVTLFIGQTEYVFYKSPAVFRGQPYDSVRMKKRKSLLGRWSYHELPFTTQYGRDWKLWQVFRELHANTLDEGGTTYEYKPDGTPINGDAETSCFFIEGTEYLEEFRDMSRTFLPEGSTFRASSEHIQIIDKPSKHIYYRGMRVMDLSREAMFTYNFLQQIDLTEDRTVKYPSMVEALIVGYMQETEDTSFVEKAVAAPRADSYERHLGHHTGYSSGFREASPSPIYLAAAAKSPNSTAKDVWDKMQPTVVDEVRLTITIPKPELMYHELHLIMSAVNTVSALGVVYDSLGRRLHLEPAEDLT